MGQAAAEAEILIDQEDENATELRIGLLLQGKDYEVDYIQWKLGSLASKVLLRL